MKDLTLDGIELLTDAQMEEILQGVIDNFLIPKHRELGMKATGEWEQSLHPKADVIRGRKYTEQLEYGRRPGKYAPIAPLIKWAKAKFGADDETAKKIAWATNHKMKEKGTSWYQKGGSDLMEVLHSPEVVNYINERAGNIIKEQVHLYVSQQIKKTFK